MPEKKAYPGTISSIILSVIVVMLLLLPFATANRMEKIRNGETKYEFKEVMCFDISRKSDFQGDDFSFIRQPFPSSEPNVGNGAVYMNYQWWRGDKAEAVHVQQPVVMSSVPIDGVVDSYGTVQVQYISGYPPLCNPSINTRFYFYFLTTLTKADILEQETTYLNVYFDAPFLSCVPISAQFNAFDGFGTWFRSHKVIKTMHGFELGEVNKVELTVDDLLGINLLDGDDILGFGFFLNTKCEPCPSPEGVQVIFDMQIYCIKEFEILTIDWIGIAMIGGGIFMGFCSILMLPHITFSGVIGRIVGKGGK